jgi:curli biogenesis system outer membrane secretion channel CsgG
VEWWLAKYLAARVGYMGLNAGGAPQLTFGLSAAYQGIGLDYAMQTSGLGAAHRLSLSYAVAGRAKAAAPRAAEEALPEAETADESGAATKMNVAVADLNPEGVSASDAAVISELLRSELVTAGLWNVVEKANMDKILAEHAFQQTGCTVQGCAVKLGKILNVQRMIVGSFGRFMKRFYVTIRVVDVATGKVMFSDTQRLAENADVQDAVRSLVSRLAKRLG